MKDIWQAPDTDVPAALLDGLAKVVRGGHAVLLLCDDRATRDRCKALLTGWTDGLGGRA